MNGVVIKFNDRSFDEGLSAEDLNQTGYVEVEGYREVAGDAIVATRIQLDDFRRYRPAGEDIEIAGPISSDYNDAAQTFELNGLVIQVSDSRVLDDGVTLDDLKAGLLVQVEGEFVSEKLIRATEIEVRDGDVEVSGTIDANDVSVSQGSLLVGGVFVKITPGTIITDDDSGDRLTIYNLIGPGTGPEAKFVEVEVAGLQKVDGQGAVYIEALQIDREFSDEPDTDQYQALSVELD